MSGVEVALAIPGLIDVTVRAARAIFDRVKVFKDADEDICRLRETVISLKEGQLYLGLEACRVAYRDRNIPGTIQVRLERQLGTVQEHLKSLQEALDLAKAGTLLKRARYALSTRDRSGQRQLASRVTRLDRSCATLKDICWEMTIAKTLQSSHLWSSNSLAIFHETWDDAAGEYLPGSCIVTAEGNYRSRGRRTNASFILEYMHGEEVAQYLCTKLTSDKIDHRHGILPVLGYRKSLHQTETIQLVFVLPTDCAQESLANAIGSKPLPDLLQRLQLCLGLARAVESVHSLDLVHKSIRPTAILLSSKSCSVQGRTEKVYLQDWSSTRGLHDVTWRLGEHDWIKGIYQHPQRQLEHAGVDYDHRHDIYSVGVCMLEILLWTPFLVDSPDDLDSTNSPCRIFQPFEDCGQRLGLIARGQLGAGDLACRVRATQAIWSEVARSELGDDKLVQLILKCLTPGFQKAQSVVQCLEALIVARGGTAPA